MQVEVNKFVREYLEEFSVLMSFSNGKVCRYKDGEIINVPDKGFMEEYSAINSGNNACQMGSFSYSNAIIPGLDIKMGRYCSIAVGLNFIAGKHPLDIISTSSFAYDSTFYIFKDASIKQIGKPHSYVPINQLIPPPPPTIFEDDVYVCTNALLKRGITLHTGCVVAQNAIVTKDVPPYAIVGGSPARILKYRFNKSTIKRLLELKWWEYHFADFDGIDLNKDINYYLDELEDRIQKQTIKPFKPRKMQFEELIQRSKQQTSIVKPTPQPTPQELEIQSLKQQISTLSSTLTYGTATNRIKNQLSYKLGRAMIENSKSLWGYIRMPYVLSYIRDIHNKEQMAYNERIKKNPSLKLPSLESYPDYKEALKCKEHLSYKLGQALIKNPFTFIFKIPSIYKNFKGNK